VIDLFIMRHGQSEADLLDRYEGRADFPLTDLGREQARLAGAWFAQRFTVDRLIGSTLKRAAETARIVAEALRVTVEYDDELMEMNNGELAGLPRTEGKKHFAHLFVGRSELALHQSFPGGETPAQFRARAEMVLSRLVDETPDGGRVLLVTHGGMTNALFRSFLRLPVDTRFALTTGDTGIHHLQLNGDNRRIRFANSLAHLDQTAAALTR